jgi:hypothetical protein
LRCIACDPLGSSHGCDKLLGFALVQCAEEQRAVIAAPKGWLIMADDVSMIVGSLLVVVICVWAGVSAGNLVRRHVVSQQAVDRTLRDVDKRDAPTLFALQMVGLAAVLIAAVSIGVGAAIAMVALIVRLVAELAATIG